MAVNLLKIDDLTPFGVVDDDKAEQMIADAVAQATLHAPCLADENLSPLKVAQAKSVLRSAVLRWNDVGSGSAQTSVAGPFQQVITPVSRKSLFWPSELADLQKICKTDTSGGAFTVDTAAAPMLFHSSLCDFAGCHCGIGGFDIPPGGVL